MPKNIIVCADGTGNKGGSTPDSNVYKIYKSINKCFSGKAKDGFELDEQIVFYDNGVGTEKNKYLRMLGGGIGFGFEDNVCDLYRFLARNYESGDRIYFFGFSRGASTVRACNGFISICGLAKGKGLRKRELEKLVKEAFEIYKKHKKNPNKAEELKNSERSHGEIDIHFMGIWDTVVALGFPRWTDITGPVSAVLYIVLRLAEDVLDLCWPHKFYRYRLTDKMKHAYQALAIDDERTAFWPYVWREKKHETVKVEQVWFIGMHSNVGGGYGRTGLAGVPLHWMMLRAEKLGLNFHDNAIKEAFDDSHVHGRMYNSRDGFGVFYRYHPREIEKLCGGRIEGDIKLHRSVVERINHRTANYAPGQLPGKFEVVESDIGIPAESRHPGKNPDWTKTRAEIDRWVLLRKGLYAIMLITVLAIIVTAGYLWMYPPESAVRHGLWGHAADILDYILPDFFAGLIEIAVVQQYYLFIGAIIAAGVYLLIRRGCRDKTVDACERLRHLIINEK